MISKNGIQKSRFRWFGHLMRMLEEIIPKKMLHIKMEKDQEQDLEPDG